jgi:hypothetical protein
MWVWLVIHRIYIYTGKTTNTLKNKPMVELQEETRKNTSYLQHLGYTVVEMWGCEWAEAKRQDSTLRRFETRPPRYDFSTLKKILDAVKDESLFGVVECDIEVITEIL